MKSLVNNGRRDREEEEDSLNEVRSIRVMGEEGVRERSERIARVKGRRPSLIKDRRVEREMLLSEIRVRVRERKGKEIRRMRERDRDRILMRSEEMSKLIEHSRKDLQSKVLHRGNLER